MSTPPANLPAAVRHTSPASLAVDAVLVLGFFTLMFFVLGPHVPSDDPHYITLWAALGASCMSGVFWLAVQMFRVVLHAQLAAKKQG
jgi:RsiW-degrading membrane proteinase PrsW (M82 family)